MILIIIYFCLNELEENNEKHIYRIWPIFNNGRILIDGYNYKIEGISSTNKQLLKIFNTGLLFSTDNQYMLVKNLYDFEIDTDGSSTFLTNNETNEL